CAGRARSGGCRAGLAVLGWPQGARRPPAFAESPQISLPPDKEDHSGGFHLHQNGPMSIAAFDVIQFVLRLILAAAFIFMGVTHFLPAVQRTMAAMIPPRMRWAGPLNPRNLVIFTGICEIAGGLGIVYPPTALAAGICLVVFLVVVFPANIYAA